MPALANNTNIVVFFAISSESRATLAICAIFARSKAVQIGSESIQIIPSYGRYDTGGIEMKDYREKFGNQLCASRCSRALTLSDVTQLLGETKSVSQLSRYENGQNLPPMLYDVEQLAAALGCTVKETRMLRTFYFWALVEPHGITDQIVLWPEVNHD